MISSIIQYRILVLISFIIINTTIVDSYAERNATITKSELKDDMPEKISTLLLQWQLSTDPATFAQENDLSYSDGKIMVYIYLDKPESISKISQDIEVTSSADNIVVAYLNSEQIMQIAQLDYVQKIDQPILAKTPPIPNTTEISDDELVLPQYAYYIIIVIGALISAGIIYFIKTKNKKQSLNNHKDHK